MERAAFEARVREQGFDEIVERAMPANEVNAMHAHDFDAQILIVAGQMTMRREFGEHVFHTGEICEITAGTLHEERAGPLGATYVAGRRRRIMAAQ
ncbi:MAG: hypothetical protein JO001_11820 [Alphaproteobacteria bacterium]|nr:hypothetical protein [Alphaproteobacteria bacterium]